MLDNMETMIDWSRAQFALTAMYHWLFVPLTLGLAVIMEYWRHGTSFPVMISGKGQPVSG